MGGDGCHRGPALLTGEHLAMPGEGLVQPWAGGGGSRFTCAGAHCCIVAVLLPSDVVSARKGAAWTMPRRYCPLFTHSHLDASFLSFFFFLKEGGEGRGKDPEIPHPTAKKATASPSAEPWR